MFSKEFACFSVGRDRPSSMLPRPSLELARSTVFGCVELVGCIVAHSSIEMVAHALKRINQGFLEASRARLVELQAWLERHVPAAPPCLRAAAGDAPNGLVLRDGSKAERSRHESPHVVAGLRVVIFLRSARARASRVSHKHPHHYSVHHTQTHACGGDTDGVLGCNQKNV